VSGRAKRKRSPGVPRDYRPAAVTAAITLGFAALLALVFYATDGPRAVPPAAPPALAAADITLHGDFGWDWAICAPYGAYGITVHEPSGKTDNVLPGMCWSAARGFFRHQAQAPIVSLPGAVEL
jgi:hypothetical protein